MPLTIISLPQELLQDILLLTHNLSTLQCIIISHTAFCDAFKNRRSLIIKSVFRNQVYGEINETHDDVIPVEKARAFVSRCTKRSGLDAVILHEALWPYLAERLPASKSLAWGQSLILAYKRVNKEKESIRLAEHMWSIVDRSQANLDRAARDCARSLVRVYREAGRVSEAICLQESVHWRLNEHSAEYRTWSRELAEAYRGAGRTGAAVALHCRLWQLYSRTIGNESKIALEWAGYLVRDYQLAGQESDALELHEGVLRSLDPTTMEYIAWARQLIHMQKRAGRKADALRVEREVWNHINPRTTGYHAWAMQLCNDYRLQNREDDAIMIEESVWIDMRRLSAISPNDASIAFHVRNAGLALAKSYRQSGQVDFALEVDQAVQEL